MGVKYYHETTACEVSTDEPIKGPTMKNVADAAEQAVSKAETTGRAQIFLDCDPEYTQAEIVVESGMRVWDRRGIESYCREYTERAMPLVSVYSHEIIQDESRHNANIARDKIIKALQEQWDLYVGYYQLRDEEVIPRSVEDLNWAARTVYGTSGKRTVSLWKESETDTDEGQYFLWVSGEPLERDPPGAVGKVADLHTFEGDYDYKEVVGTIADAAREHLAVDDPNSLWSYHCFLHHSQYNQPA